MVIGRGSVQRRVVHELLGSPYATGERALHPNGTCNHIKGEGRCFVPRRDAIAFDTFFTLRGVFRTIYISMCHLLWHRRCFRALGGGASLALSNAGRHISQHKRVRWILDVEVLEERASVVSEMDARFQL